MHNDTKYEGRHAPTQSPRLIPSNLMTSSRSTGNNSNRRVLESIFNMLARENPKEALFLEGGR